MAVIVDGKLMAIRGISADAVEQWLIGFDPASCRDELCAVGDKLFPIRVPLKTASDDRQVGWLLVGSRPDGSLLSKDEQKALVEVAGPITSAIRIVTRREHHDQSLVRRIEAIERRLSLTPDN